MKESTKERLEGKFHQVKGKIKEAVGETVNSSKLTIKGKTEKIAGIAQEKIGQAKKILGK